MKTSTASLSVAVGDQVAWIRIDGRASFNNSVDFKTLVTGLWDRGCSHFVLDLTECLLMDSTFLGVLAGLGLRYPHNGSKEATFELLNPNARISDLLENLGVVHLFKVVQGPPTTNERLRPVGDTPAQRDGVEVTRTCLEAHRTLMDINPANVPKFKDCTEFLQEDLRRKEGGEKTS
jgi:anti-sigma B factor antagonist